MNFHDNSGLEWEVAGNWKTQVEGVGGAVETGAELAIKFIDMYVLLGGSFANDGYSISNIL
jgi:hypothetical protein